MNLTNNLLETTREFEKQFEDILPSVERAGRVQDVLDIILGRFTLRKLQNLSKCESPIEKLMCLCLWEQMEPLKSNYVIHLLPQWEVQIEGREYRVDFFIEAWAKCSPHKVVKVVIECDGHERTPEQAKLNKGRDRAFTEKGYHVLRYTGKEITADPFRCAQDVFATVRKLLRANDD
ncbi:MAG TPA: DUF559 domain-containing protein [Desulfitobacterium dehalogenans]|uniref:DUF559 domain-containing protein n=1 Tax=Desulfitobacterium dehalogenans TaxID=36854 RepID=A0A7C6Z3N9_9FIRM|nr:DUF559 domain-containing protein [Desulfitobacterium dehalogenans]